METTTTTETSPMMKAEPEKEHQWLERLVGEWTFEAEGGMGEQSWKTEGTETVRSLGGVWIVAEGEGEMHGSRETSIMTLGFDPRTKRFVGTWVGSMMTHLWLYDGQLDADEKVLTLESEGPSMSGDGSLAKYRDVIEVKSEDHRTLTAHLQGEDGSWQPFMKTHYRRRR